jgi:outer membrane murein-binding lipoprotein Lpp
MSSLPSNVSPYVPRGPVAHEIHGVRDAVILLITVVVLFGGLTSFFGIRAFNKVDTISGTVDSLSAKVSELQDENNKLKASAAENQRANDARALAGQQALSLLVQQVSQIHTLNPDQIQSVLGAINAAIDQTTQNLKKQGVPVTPIPKLSLSPSPSSSPGGKTQSAGPRCSGPIAVQATPLVLGPLLPPTNVQVCVHP